MSRSKLDVKNHSASPCKGELKVRLGEIEFAHPVALDAEETKTLTLDKSTYKQLSLAQSKAVVAQRHGEQNLYDLTVEFSCAGKVLDVE